MKLRFAPSPTGLLHVGNVRAALANYLFARRHGGQFLLRLDDTDAARNRPEYAEAIAQDLAWLGIAWDDSFRQSDRLAATRRPRAGSRRPAGCIRASKARRSCRPSATSACAATCRRSTTARC